jgi:hypothetical protein
MRRIIFYTAISFCCIFNFSKVYAGERGNPVFDDRHWKLGWSQNQGDGIYEEYVVDGDNVENWSELVTIQYYPGLQKQTNPDVFEALLHTNLSSVCPGIKWDSLYQTEDERIWRWSITGCQGQPDQSEIARMKKTDEGFHVWHYAIKKSPMPSENETLWLEKLKAIQISKI